MSQVISIGRLILFFMSSAGYWEFFHKKCKINLFFLPGFTVAFQISVLFAGGILNCLKPVFILLFVIGLILVTYYLITEKKDFVIKYINEGYIFFFCAVCICLLAVKGKVFIDYDNFSHWGLVVRNMLRTDRFPNFQDTIILFQSYPLGSSVFIYFFSKIISQSESVQMLAQCYMMLSFILPLFKYGKNNKVFHIVILSVFTNFIFCYNTKITTILVDTLLPLEGMAAVFFIFSECIKKKEKGEKVSLLCAIPFLCTAIQIKNSGVFFVALSCVVIITAVIRYKMDWRSGAAACISPFISLYLWQAHCAYVFSAGLTTKHAMSISNYINNFSSKTQEDITVILEKIRSILVGGKEFFFLIGFLVVVTVLSVIFIRQGYKRIIEVWAVCVSIYVIYMLGMFFMYLFSMPTAEATVLDGWPRYRRTIFVALYYIIMWFLLCEFSQIESRKKRYAALFVTVLVLVITWRYERGSFVTIFSSPSAHENDLAERRAWIENAIEEYGIPSNKSYIICSPNGDGGYTWVLCRYLFNSNSSQVSSRNIKEENQLKDAAQYDYVILYDSENEIIKQWVAENYPDQIDQDVIIIE